MIDKEQVFLYLDELESQVEPEQFVTEVVIKFNIPADAAHSYIFEWVGMSYEKERLDIEKRYQRNLEDIQIDRARRLEDITGHRDYLLSIVRQ